MKINRLKEVARECCEWREHSMGNFKETGVRGTWDHLFTARCKRCGMHVYVEPTPAPNSIDVFGEAVALDCEGDL